MEFLIGLFVLGVVAELGNIFLPEPKDNRGLLYDWIHTLFSGVKKRIK